MQPVFYIEKKKLPKCICIENKLNEYLINEEFFGENFINRYRESNITSGNNVENVVSNKTLKGSETEKNLYKTFAGESRAVVKYMLYAEQAKSESYMWLGEVFDNTALNELAHARVVAKTFLRIVGTSLDNLKDSLAGETNEYENLYKEFQETAEREGFT